MLRVKIIYIGRKVKIFIYLGSFCFGIGSFFSLLYLEIPYGLWGILLDASVNTIIVFSSSVLSGLAVAICLTILPASGCWSVIAETIIHFCRSTPLVCAMLLSYWLSPLFGAALAVETCAILAIGLIEGGCLAHIARNAFRRTWHALEQSCFTIGLSKPQSIQNVVGPVCLSILIPHFYNFLLFVLSAAALSSLIGVMEISMASKVIATTLVDPIITYSIVLFFYFTVSSFCFLTIFVFENYLYKSENFKLEN